MSKCILIYDDDPDILFVTATLLKQKNYRVETREVCDNILTDIEDTNPDLILMDLWIPLMGGEKAITLMKLNKSTSHLPVILFSANADIVAICERLNANGFLKKPFEVSTLFKAVAKIL